MNAYIENPLIGLDYPDPDVIRVGDTYYMVSTTMYFMPGCEILRSYDLLHWEHLTYVYETLDSTPQQRLEGDQNAYAKGMWAASLRCHNGIFYISFVANDTHKTYLYTSESITGPWKKQYIEGFYHDSSLLFDDDGSIYIVYGNSDIWLTQLKGDLSGPLEGGVHRCIISDRGNQRLGYEGSHFYKINGRYYVFLIHSRRDRWMRTEACFAADSIDGAFTGCDVLEDTLDYCDQGVAQGGIVDTPEGNWYAVLFQDRGAVGRIPVILPVSWKDGFPVFGIEGRIPKQLGIKSLRPEASYEPLTGSDDFRGENPRHWWQWNHEPWRDACGFDAQRSCYWIRNDKRCDHLLQAPNTLTQRMGFPCCEVSVILDGSGLKEGDYAGLCVLQKAYGMIALTVSEGQYALVVQGEGKQLGRNAVNDSRIRLMIRADFNRMKDEAVFFYQADGEWKQLGTAWKLSFSLEHFTGNRAGLFSYATSQTGGTAVFSDFRWRLLETSRDNCETVCEKCDGRGIKI